MNESSGHIDRESEIGSDIEVLRKSLREFANVVDAYPKFDFAGVLGLQSAEINRLQRLALASIENFRISIPDFSSVLMDSTDLSALQRLSEEAAASFVVPKESELSQWLRGVQIPRFITDMSELQSQLASIYKPWIDAANPIKSVEGVIGLQRIGHILASLQPFEGGLTESLRVDLGDWRDEVDWPSEVFVDPFLRKSFYEHRGVNTTLTAFPGATFRHLVVESGLDASEGPFSGKYYAAVDQETTEQEAAFLRTEAAFRLLHRFERQLREFISNHMQRAFGDDWIKQQIPPDIREGWHTKREKAQLAGEPQRPLIEYADFTDYVKIITRRDNWNTVFGSFFERVDSIRESLQRLYPIRVCTMHSRYISQDDELFLLAETKRVFKAIEPGS